MRILWPLLLLVVIAVVIIACSISSSDNIGDESGEFAIYLTAQDIPDDQIPQTDPNTVELNDEPVISTSDIISYSWETHEIKLTDSAYETIQGFGTGMPFVACVGGKPIYIGAFWPSYSSKTFDGVVIDPTLGVLNHTIAVQLGYPESFFTGEDLRSDPRIYDSLEQAGKLK